MKYKIIEDESKNKYVYSIKETYKIDNHLNDKIIVSDDKKIIYYINERNRLENITNDLSYFKGLNSIGKCKLKDFNLTLENKEIIKIIDNTPKIDKEDFIQGFCVEFAIVLLKQLKKLDENKENKYSFGVIEGLIFDEEADEDEKIKHYTEACHGVVIKNDNLEEYFDVNGLNKFDKNLEKNLEEYRFSEKPFDIQLRKIGKNSFSNLFGGLDDYGLEIASLYIKQNPELLESILKNEKENVLEHSIEKEQKNYLSIER